MLGLGSPLAFANFKNISLSLTYFLISYYFPFLIFVVGDARVEDNASKKFEHQCKCF